MTDHCSHTDAAITTVKCLLRVKNENDYKIVIFMIIIIIIIIVIIIIIIIILSYIRYVHS